MENTTKIAFVILFFVFGCTPKSSRYAKLFYENGTPSTLELGDLQPKKLNIFAHNDSLYFLVERNNFLDIFNSNDEEFILVDSLFDIIEKKSIPINAVLDFESYRPIDNELGMYQDTFSLYLIFGSHLSDRPVHFLNLKNSPFELLGGGYYKHNSKIFWRGSEISSVDINSFKTINLRDTITGSDYTYGLDKNSLYHNSSELKNEYYHELRFDKVLMDSIASSTKKR